MYSLHKYFKSYILMARSGPVQKMKGLPSVSAAGLPMAFAGLECYVSQLDLESHKFRAH